MAKACKTPLCHKARVLQNSMGKLCEHCVRAGKRQVQGESTQSVLVCGGQKKSNTACHEVCSIGVLRARPIIL